MACRCLSVLILKPMLATWLYVLFLSFSSNKETHHFSSKQKKGQDTPFKPRAPSETKKTHTKKHQPFQHPFFKKKTLPGGDRPWSPSCRSLNLERRVTYLAITEKFTKNCQVLRKVPKTPPQEKTYPFEPCSMFIFSGLTPTSFR